MQLFLLQTFNEAIFIGEIVSSILIIFLISLSIFYFKNNKIIKVLLIGTSLIGAIFIGQGIANVINSAPIFGLLPNLILASLFFNAFKLIPTVISAQIIGSLFGFIIFRGYKYVFKDFEIKEEENAIKLSNLQFSLKEIIAQVIFILASMFITFATFNNGLSHIDISPLVINLISLIVIIGLFLIFLPVKGFMISPIVSLFIHLSLVNNFKNVLRLSKNIDSTFLSTYIFQLIANVSVTIVIGLIANQIKWWT